MISETGAQPGTGREEPETHIDGAPLVALLEVAAGADERRLLEEATRVLTSLLGERGSCVLLDGAPRVVLATDRPTLRDRPIDLGRYPEVAAALERRKVVAIEDVARDARMEPVRGLLPRSVGAVAVVPLVSGERRLGAIVVRSTAARRMTARELATAAAVGRLATELLEAARLRRRFESLALWGKEALVADGPSATACEGAEWPPVDQAVAPPSPSRRVMVIDDDPSHGAIVAAVLSRRGYQVEVFHDASTGVAHARETPPNLVLLDVWMPTLDGLTAAEQLREEARTRDIPILFLSACDDVGARVRGLRLGATDYLAKPFYAAELLVRVERTLAQAAAREQLRAQAHIDELTGLGNLRHLRERLAVEESRAVRYGTPFAVVMLDVDRLKEINDRYGHAAGDAALAAVGRVLREEVRDTDVPARYGGDEFVVLLPHATLDLGTRFADRVLQRLRGLDLGGHSITVSGGVAAWGEGGAARVEELLTRADTAAYCAKHQGGDRICAAEPRAHVPALVGTALSPGVK